MMGASSQKNLCHRDEGTAQPRTGPFRLDAGLLWQESGMGHASPGANRAWVISQVLNR